VYVSPGPPPPSSPFSTADNSWTDLGNGRWDPEEEKFAIEPGLLGFVNSCYQLGSIFAVPIAPWFANRYGRRWSIMLGSLIMVVGALLQGFAQHGKLDMEKIMTVVTVLKPTS
jgi:MFS family permease